MDQKQLDPKSKHDHKLGECGLGECGPNHRSGSYQKNQVKILHGLRRVEGQVRGIQRMVEEERYCVEILNQIAAARMALARLALIVLEDHTKGCVSRAVAEQEQKDEIIGELMEVFKKLI
jgi:CsoR family transcriptional regulator, copper-sensing transcriptional repressor